MAGSNRSPAGGATVVSVAARPSTVARVALLLQIAPSTLAR
jgi:hypothetical protein